MAFRNQVSVTTISTGATLIYTVPMLAGWSGPFMIEVHAVGPGGYAYYLGGGSTNGTAATINTDLYDVGYTQAIEVNTSGNSIQVYTSGVVGVCTVWVDIYADQ